MYISFQSVKLTDKECTNLLIYIKVQMSILIYLNIHHVC